MKLPYEQDFSRIYIEKLARATLGTEVTGRIFENKMDLDEVTFTLRLTGRLVTRTDGQIWLVGNGGSASIASHIAVDWQLAGFRAVALNDACAITSHANDFGVEAIFSKQLELLRTKSPDVLIAMSCSGKSRYVLEAVRYARTQGMGTVTMSGFDPANSLRVEGDINFYVPSTSYGFVQMAHLSILHMVGDFEGGWTP